MVVLHSYRCKMIMYDDMRGRKTSTTIAKNGGDGKEKLIGWKGRIRLKEREVGQP